MLEPAIKYSEELKKKMYDTWYDIKYQYYNNSPTEILASSHFSFTLVGCVS